MQRFFRLSFVNQLVSAFVTSRSLHEVGRLRALGSLEVVCRDDMSYRRHPRVTTECSIVCSVVANRLRVRPEDCSVFAGRSTLEQGPLLQLILHAFGKKTNKGGMEFDMALRQTGALLSAQHWQTDSCRFSLKRM